VLWYSYFDLQRSDNFTQHWSDLQTAANFGKPAALQIGQTPAAAPATPAPTTTPAPRPARTRSNMANSSATSASGDVLTPFGRFNGAAIEALAQLALLVTLIAGTRLAIGRASSRHPPR
jgi:hypothetical protein